MGRDLFAVQPETAPQVESQPKGRDLFAAQPTVQPEVALNDNTISDSRALPLDSVQPVETTLGQEVLGGLDVAKTIVSSAVAEPFAGLAGLITSPFVGAEEASKNIEAVREFITLDTATDLGKRNLKAVGELVSKGVDLANFSASGLTGIGQILSGQGIEQAAKSVESVQEKGVSSALGQSVLDATGSPELAAIAHSLPTAALEAIGVKGLSLTKLSKEKLSGNVSKAITQAAPDLKTIKKRAAKTYSDLDKTGIRVKPKVYENFTKKLETRLKKEGIDPTLHPKSTATINRFVDDIGQSKKPSELETLRKIAKDAASSIDKPDARLGNIIINELDKAIDSLSNQIGGQFKEARALSQRGFKSQSIVDMIEDASHTASGLENGLRIEARKILKSKKKRRGFTKDELQTLSKIEQGTTTANIAKFLGKFGISEGQATSMLGASIGIGGGGAIGAMFGTGGAAIGALTVPAIGQIAKKTAQKITLNNTRFADDLVRAGKSARNVVSAYLKHTPKAQRSVSNLTDLLLETNITAADIKKLPSSKTASGKLMADAFHFASEIKRRATQAGSAVLIAQPEIEEI